MKSDVIPLPNVILIMLDSLRRDYVGCYGNDWIRTPNIDALAGEGVRFVNAYPEALPTLPVRRAMHTGMRTFPCPRRSWSAPAWLLCLLRWKAL